MGLKVKCEQALHLGTLQVPADGWARGSHCGLPRELLSARGKNPGNLKAGLPLMFPVSSMWQ